MNWGRRLQCFHVVCNANPWFPPIAKNNLTKLPVREILPALNNFPSPRAHFVPILIDQANVLNSEFHGVKKEILHSFSTTPAPASLPMHFEISITSRRQISTTSRWQMLSKPAQKSYPYLSGRAIRGKYTSPSQQIAENLFVRQFWVECMPNSLVSNLPPLSENEVSFSDRIPYDLIIPYLKMNVYRRQDIGIRPV